jgi:hypothetical protein
MGSETITVPRSLTFPVRDAASLLSVAGFHNPTGVYLPFENFYSAEASGFNLEMHPPFSEVQTHNAVQIDHGGSEIVRLFSDDRLTPTSLLHNG